MMQVPAQNPMRQQRYGPIATNPVPSPNTTMPGQMPMGYPPNMQTVQRPGMGFNATQVPLQSQQQTQLPPGQVSLSPQVDQAQQKQLQNMQNASDKVGPKPSFDNKNILDRNQMKGAIGRRMKGGF